MAPQAEAEANELTEARLAVLAAVTEGDPGAAFDIVSSLLSEGHGFESILFDVIAPLQVEIGRRWHQGDYAIAEEHAATGAIETLVALLAGTMTIADEGPRIVVVTAEGDAHSLPARMLAAHLLYLGWRVTYLGASVPAADLRDYLQTVDAGAAVVSCALTSRLFGARASVKAAHDAGVPVLVGGGAFGHDDRRARLIGADGWARSSRDVDEMLRTWQPDPTAAERARRVTPDAERLQDLRLQVLARAADEGAVPPANTADLELAYDGLLAAMLVDEPGLVAELAAWRGRMSPAAGPAIEAEALLRALRAGVKDHSATAVSYLDEALIALSQH